MPKPRPTLDEMLARLDTARGLISELRKDAGDLVEHYRAERVPASWALDMAEELYATGMRLAQARISVLACLTRQKLACREVQQERAKPADESAGDELN